MTNLVSCPMCRDPRLLLVPPDFMERKIYEAIGDKKVEISLEV